MRSGTKRVVDLVGAGLGLGFLSPVLLVTALMVRIVMGRPVLFRQVRAGMGGKPFVLYKFRTMEDRRDPQGRFLPDEERLTRLGQFLRRTSLDELPELWNVIKGDMSLVGPRPLLVEYLPLYSSRQARRHEVKPGITGWAQVRGRNRVPWEERLEMDVWYVENRTLARDLEILVRTLVEVVRRNGISQEGVVTMTRFRGSVR